MKVDAVDEQILAILATDARRTNREIGEQVGLSDTGIRKRLKRLNANGTAKLTTIVNPAVHGFGISAFVRLQTSPAVARDVAEALARFSFVPFVSLTSGHCNVHALVLARDDADLIDIVHFKLRPLPGVHRVETNRIVGTSKLRLDLILISADKD